MGPFAWASQKNKLRFVRIYFENPTFDIVRKDKAAKFSIIGAVAWRLSILLEILSFHQLLFHVNYNSWIQLDISSWYANMCLCMFDISILSHGHGWVYCRRYFWFWFESEGMSWCRLPAVWQSGSLGGVASQEGGRPRSRPGPTTTTTTTARIMSGYFVHAATRVPSHKTAVSVCFYSHSQRIFEQLFIINVIKVLALL